MLSLIALSLAHVPFAPGVWVITEIDPRPIQDGGQWFEVYNNSSVTQNLVELGFRNGAGQEISIVAPLLVAAESVVVLAASGSPVEGAALHFDPSFQLDGMLVHFDHISGDLDSVSWDQSWPFPGGLSPRALHSPWANNLPYNWCSGSSPGQLNPACPEDTQDLDQDGYTIDDCDDQNPEVHPGQPDFPDGVDQDCDGPIDEDPLDSAPDSTDTEAPIDSWSFRDSSDSIDSSDSSADSLPHPPSSRGCGGRLGGLLLLCLLWKRR